MNMSFEATMGYFGFGGGAAEGNYGGVRNEAVENAYNYNISMGENYAAAAAEAQMMNIWSTSSREGQEAYFQVSQVQVSQVNVQGSGTYSRKVFIGGLPPDLKASIISAFFEQFGDNDVDWPHRKCTGGDTPPNGYAFIIFANDHSVDELIKICTRRNGKMNIMIKNEGKCIKSVQVRPWYLTDQVYCTKAGPPESFRFSIFVGGVPRTTTAHELYNIMQKAIGSVEYVSLEVDNDTQYPKGAAQVVFNNRETYLRAIGMRLLTMSTQDQEKDIEIKPYLENCVQCEICGLVGTSQLCPEVCCLMYLCDPCWTEMHARRGILHHRPMSKLGSGNPLRNIANRNGAIALNNNPFVDRMNRNNHQPQLCHCRMREPRQPQQLPPRLHNMIENVPPVMHQP